MENEMTSTTIVAKKNPGCLVQLVWFALVGWWLGQAWVAVAWFFAATIIGMPLAVMMLNRVPEVMALRGETELLVRSWNGHMVVTEVPQYNILLRALYFVLVGWWASALWLELAYALCMTIIGLPLGFWMFDWTPAIVSLRR
jgi:uncharacterized membrane protein YccF (DUF307 family)